MAVIESWNVSRNCICKLTKHFVDDLQLMFYDSVMAIFAIRSLFIGDISFFFVS